MSFLDIELKPEYRSLLDNVIKDFYVPVLKQATMYKRAVGFFSSSALLELSAGICGLVENGGKIQLIASPKLSAEDIEAINDGIKRRDDVIEEALLRELREPQGRFEEARLNLLSNLIAAGRLDIKIAFLESDNAVGMFHEKLGLMYDSDNHIIAFSGSMNESANAFTTNYEAIDVFTSWSKDEDRVFSKQSAFNAMWNDYEPSIRVLDFPKINAAIIEKYKITDTIETFSEEEFLMKKPSHEDKKETSIGPAVPEFVHMRPYQMDAINEWASRDYRGIFDMATGTGKTYTALAAISRLYQDKKKNLAVIIICPYQHLVEQWKEDIVAFGMKPIVCYSASSQRNWRDRLKTAVTSFNLGVQKHFCMVTTNATFSLDYVQTEILRLSGNVILVVDEAHNFGAENLSKALLPHIPYRLALSATIDRHGDPEGTQKLYDYFGEKCIEYTLKDAIDNDMLTPYYETELVDVKSRLRDLSSKKERLIRDDAAQQNDIDRYKKVYDSLVAVSGKNKATMQLIAYAEQIRDWLSETYKEKEDTIREDLETKVNEIFERMYHGHRRVVIDKKYQTSLLTTVADKEIAAGESEGSNRVKNFAFIAGLVSLAKEKIVTDGTENGFNLSSEPYPLVMDAPFSNADETHTANISKVLPEIAEQVIMFVMQKDWNYAQPVMSNRVGVQYHLNKISETYTQLK